MNELRSGIRGLLERVPVLAPVMPWAFIPALVYPVLGMIGSMTYLGFFESIRALLWLLYLAGLAMCFAQELDWAVGAAFAVNALGHLISMLRYFTFNSLIYTAFYALLAWVFLRDLVAGGQLHLPHAAAAPAQPFAAPAPDDTLRFCPTCGEPVDLSGRFCPYCGNSYPVESGQAAPFYGNSGQAAPFYGNNGQAAPFYDSNGQAAPFYDSNGQAAPFYDSNGQVAPFYGSNGQAAPQRTGEKRPIRVPMDAPSLCAAPLALVFSALLTGSVLFKLLSGFNIFALIANLPVLLICVGCWLTCYHARTGLQSTAGMMLVEGVLIAELVLCCLPLLAGAVLGVYAIITGTEDIEVGLAILGACVLALLLSFFYWNGFRQSVRSVRRSVWDGAVEWKASIYCIVCLCIGALTKLSSLTSHSVGKSLLKAGIDSIASVMRYTQETRAYADVVRDGLYTICGIGNSSLTDVSTVCSAAAVVCAVVILIQMRIRNGAVRSAVG